MFETGLNQLVVIALFYFFLFFSFEENNKSVASRCETINAAICYLAGYAEEGGRRRFVESYVARLIDALRNPKDVEKRRGGEETIIERQKFHFSISAWAGLVGGRPIGHD